MTLNLKIKAPSGETMSISVESDATFLSLKESISGVVGIAAGEMRVVCAGRILRDDEAQLGALGLVEGSTLHIVKMAANSASAAAASPAAQAAAPSQNPRLAGAGLPDRDAMRQMMSNPMMQALLDNPELMASIMEADPRMRAMAEQNPEIRQMLRDPAFLRQMTSAMRNPALMDEMMRNQDRALSNIESIPGGMSALSGMYQSMERTERALAPTVPGVTDESNRRFAESIGADLDANANAAGPNESALPNPWAAPTPTRSNPTATSPGAGAAAANPYAALGGGFNPFAFGQIPQTNPAQPGSSQPAAATASTAPNASMQGDPFLNALLAMNQQQQAAPSPATPNPADAQAQRLQMLGQLLQFQQALQASQQGSNAPQQPQQPMFNPFFGGNPYGNSYGFAPQPSAAAAAAPVVSAPAAPTIPPEERFKDELEMMNGMGFTETAKNIKALLAAGGNVDSAINYLLDM